MNYLIQFLVAMTATVAVAILFATPKRELIFCGLSGAISWIFYYIVDERSGNTVAACLAATFILAVFSRTLAVLRRNPATIYLPGAGSRSLLHGVLSDFRRPGAFCLQRTRNTGDCFGHCLWHYLWIRHTGGTFPPADTKAEDSGKQEVLIFAPTKKAAAEPPLQRLFYRILTKPLSSPSSPPAWILPPELPHSAAASYRPDPTQFPRRHEDPG